MADGRFETTGELPGGRLQASGGLDLRRQGTWMGARRTKRGRAAGSAARAGRFRGKSGVHAAARGGLVSHCQQAMMNARNTCLSL